MTMTFEFVGNPDNAAPMAAYMRDQFVFLGLKSQARKAQEKPLIAESKRADTETVLEWVNTLYAREEREYQYVAIDLAVANAKRLNLKQLHGLIDLIQQKAWWDSVDAWRKVYDVYLKRHQEDKAEIFSWFYGQPDFWLRRLAITLQLLEKETLDTKMLTRAIEYDIETDEFFIQKAIGWALRGYSKFRPDWVREFIEAHELSALAVREGSKYL